MYKGKKVSRCWPSNRILILLVLLCPIFFMIYSIIFNDPSTVANKKKTAKYHNTNMLQFASHPHRMVDIKHLLSGVAPQYYHICHSILNGKKDMTANEIWSPSFEDWYIYHNFFKDPIYHHSKESRNRAKKSYHSPGIYIDIGHDKPFVESVSAFFDICLGWKGMCIYSPDVATYDYRGSDRSCSVINDKCLWKANPLKISMYGGQDDSSVCTADKSIDINIQQILQKYPIFDKFGDMLIVDDVKQELMRENMIDIDFISLDIEGDEQNFMLCFPFHRYSVKVWSIRTLTVLESRMDELMQHLGYLKFDHLSFQKKRTSAIYVKRVAVYPWTNDTIHHFQPQNMDCIYNFDANALDL